MSPGPDCDETSPFAAVGASDLVFAATGRDDDRDLRTLQFTVWKQGSSTKIYDQALNVDAGGRASFSLARSNFTDGQTYQWAVRSIDSTGAASEYAPPGSGTCTFDPSDSTGYRLNVSPRDTSDAPGDTNGDTQPDLWVITPEGNLDMYSGAEGDLHMNIPGAHRRGINLTADGDKDGKADYPGHGMGSDGKPALITHHGDFAPGDGIQDLLARMPDGKSYVYRGDGYGSVDIEQRTELWLPSNAPAPSTFTQIFATGDLDNDRRPELLVTAGTDLWALTGYTGSTFTTATKPASGWDALDVVNVGAKDLLFRNPGDGKMWLRKGKSNGKGGTDVAAFASGGVSLGGADVSYGGSWTASNIPMVMGTPDTSGDGIPDLWALTGSGTVKLYRCTTTDTTAGVLVVVGGWSSMKAFG
ncbi:hypothetical protein AQF52_0146 [Streptomyces venezuelae]|nr:hypothetical protein AQF52_0146 [Streptomyces venezuelae]